LGFCGRGDEFSVLIKLTKFFVLLGSCGLSRRTLLQGDDDDNDEDDDDDNDR